MKSIILLIFLSFSFIGEAQIIPNPLKKATRKIEEKIIEMGVEEIEGVFEKEMIEKDSTEISSEGRMDNEQPPARNNSEQEDIPFVPNSFIGSLHLTMTSFKNDKMEKNNPIEVELHLKKDKTGMVMAVPDNPKSLMIMDLKDNKIIMVQDMEGERKGMKMKRPNFNMTKKMTDQEVDIQKTGKTKVIDGYRCEEYILTTEDGVSHAWVTKDLKAHWSDLNSSFMGLSNAGKDQDQNQFKDVDGFPIESTYVSSNGKDKMVTRCTNIKPGVVNEGLFDMGKYSIQDLSKY